MDNGKRITKLVDCCDSDVIYGFIIADEKYNIDAEIKRIKNDPEFIEKYGDFGWDIFDIMGMFDFSFEWQVFDWNDVAEI